jgi:O-antigen ligase
MNQAMTTSLGPPQPGSHFPQGTRPARLAGSVGSVGRVSVKWIVGFLLVNMAVALLMQKVPLAAGAHALVTFAYGLWLCFTRNRPLQLAQWMAYAVGAEALWRMCEAPIPWEFAKYSICLVCLISLVRSGGIRGSRLPAFYLALLVPAGFLTFVNLPLDEARQAVSFNLSGPTCLALCILRCSSMPLNAAGFQRVCVALLAPVLGVAALALFGLATTEAEFTHDSNLVASGGFGPNQVSSILSLGAVLALFLHLGEKRSKVLKVGFVFSALWLLAQAALTFSRTGIYLFGAAFGVAAVFLVQWKGKGGRLVLFGVVLCSAACAILPMLDAYTGGQLTQRFNDTGLTGRTKIAKLDLQVFLAHPILGAGAGMSKYYRAELGDAHAAHTEYTRLLADHGMLGAVAMVVLLIMTGNAFLRARGPWAKAIVSALAVWACLFMAVTGMRLAAPAFLLGLIHAQFLADNPALGMATSKARRSQLPGLAGPYRRRVRAH